MTTTVVQDGGLELTILPTTMAVAVVPAAMIHIHIHVDVPVLIDSDVVAAALVSAVVGPAMGPAIDVVSGMSAGALARVMQWMNGFMQYLLAV